MLPVTQTAMPGIGLTIPVVIERRAEPYLACRIAGKMRDLPQFAPPKFAELHAWMEARGMAPAGPAFFRYRRFGSDGSVELDVGTPTMGAEAGSGAITADEVPAGRYAFATYTGPYDRLYDAFAMLNGWISGRDLVADGRKGESGRRMGCQMEVYRISPMQEKDPAKMETDLLVRLAD